MRPLPGEHPLVFRTRVAQAVADEYLHREFAWGDYDCARLAHAALKALGLRSPLTEVPRYTTERGALKAMRRLGLGPLDQVIDSLGFDRISPASTLPADLVGFQPQTGAFGVALGVVMSGGRCLAFVDHEILGGCRAVIGKGFETCVAAWRVKF